MEISKKIVFYTAIVGALLTLAGCLVKDGHSQPNWIENPDRHQAVGSCGSHALGKYKQKECAMTRARLELAARKGIEIKSMSLMTERANNMASSSTLNQQVTQEVNTKIKARLLDSYHDKNQDILWVLVEEN
jgi:hypothetical protein